MISLARCSAAASLAGATLATVRASSWASTALSWKCSQMPAANAHSVKTASAATQGAARFASPSDSPFFSSSDTIHPIPNMASSGQAAKRRKNGRNRRPALVVVVTVAAPGTSAWSLSAANPVCTPMPSASAVSYSIARP